MSQQGDNPAGFSSGGNQRQAGPVPMSSSAAPSGHGSTQAAETTGSSGGQPYPRRISAGSLSSRQGRNGSIGSYAEPTVQSSLAGFAGPPRSAAAPSPTQASPTTPHHVNSTTSTFPPPFSPMDVQPLPPISMAGNTAVAPQSTVAMASPDIVRSASAINSTATEAFNFPVLPAPQSVPNQAYQTPSQVQSILSLPPAILLHLARTKDLSAQQAIAHKANVTSYLTAMTIPPPSPDHLVKGFADLQLAQLQVAATQAASTSSATADIVIPPAPVPPIITSIGEHPAIPLLLGQVFSPPTPGITVPFSAARTEFQPVFASVEDWSQKAARERVQAESRRASDAVSSPVASTSNGGGASAPPVRPPLHPTHSFTEREVAKMAAKLKHWAIAEEEKGINRQVMSSKGAAVLLASQVGVRTTLVANATRTVETSEAMAATTSASGEPTVSTSLNSANGASASVTPAIPATSTADDLARAKAILNGGEEEFESAMQTIDLTPYAESYKLQLAALASGYFAQLHREAVSRLLATTAPASQFEGGKALNVRAAASAAIAANALAANEMAHEAQEQLKRFGADVPKLVTVGETGGLAVLEIDPQAIARPPSTVQSGSSSSQLQQPQQQQQQTNQGSTGAGFIAPTAGSSNQPSEVTHFLANAVTECTEEKRDYFLAYAHSLYSTDPTNESLLPILHTLDQVHPNHLPTLLLMSCVYYTTGMFESSIYFNDRILKIDENYVEAMSNMGTTLRAMGKWLLAEDWWWKAIKLRPTYWDATENLLGVLCNPSSNPIPNPPAGVDPPPTKPRYSEALSLCDYVDAQIFRPDPVQGDEARFEAFENPNKLIPRPRQLPISVPSSHVHRLQNLFYAKGNLKLAIGETIQSLDEFYKAIEVALSLPAWTKERALVENVAYPVTGVSVRDLVIATTIMGSIIAVHSRHGGTMKPATLAEAQRFKMVDADGVFHPERLFRKVREFGDSYATDLVRASGGSLPIVLLQPEDLNKLLPVLFPETGGVLPCMLESSMATEEQATAHRQSVQLTSQTTSTMLLTVAKIFQDFMAAPTAVKGVKLNGLPITQSILLPLYYVALALHPSPSTCNNLGILLSTMNAATLVTEKPGSPPVLVNGQQMALKYYRAGLALDSKHPHLYTNLGSLLKDMGQLPQAVQMYRQAVEFNPTFDVALANLANAIKDTGHIQESIPYYRRAVEVNPKFPEAICGLVNALGGVCDWVGRGGVNEKYIVDNAGDLVAAQNDLNTPGPVRQGYLGQISELIAKQLVDGQQYGAGVVRSFQTADKWISDISQFMYDLQPEAIGPVAETWMFRLQPFLGGHRPPWANEGGFVIRLVERLMRRVQRRWYIAVYQKTHYTTEILPAIAVQESDVVKYRRPVLPPSLSIPPVPTVLPFHVFTYPVSARETRLISHRTGLRISFNTLTQPWLPRNVYPPPPPPLNGKINIGYVSSDLGNHPLSHLMQSVFGFHDPVKFNVFLYATSPSDKSPYRQKIEHEAQHFLDVSSWSNQAIVERIVGDQIHILINLSGYTKGARNEVFACRPAPVQMSYMGFAGTLAAGWCDYFVVDPIVCPPHLVSGNQWRRAQGHTGQMADSAGDGPTDFEGDPDPESLDDTYVYTEKLIYMPHSYFVTDHKQSWFEDNLPPPPGVVPIADDGTKERAWAIEEDRRWQMRKAMFPDLPDDTVIFANWNQLYKIDPFVYRMWLRILTKHPNSVLWLLRFPAPGEHHLKETARKWAGEDVAKRVIFTDVTNKNEHIRRGRIPDLFLDTTECNAHTTACDALAQGTPVLTWPRHTHKMCSRVATSVVVATGFGPQMIAKDDHDYERRAVSLARSLQYIMLPPNYQAHPSDPEARPQRRGRGELSDLRRNLFLTRSNSPLFDTRRWVRNVEKGYQEAWSRWVDGTEFEDSGEWDECGATIRRSGCIWVADEIDGPNIEQRKDYF
ncbi:TPR-like protein [Meredithblackwellia eburnea MCA 4105]